MSSEVLVVGAGPTGLLLAAELCRRGVECALIDARGEPQHWDRATVVHPRSLELFESLGIVDSFLAAGVRQKQARMYSDGELLGATDLSLCGSRYGFNLGLSEEATESILGEYLAERGGEVRRGRRLVGLEQNGAGVVATVAHGAGREEVAAAWAVGCDGYHSVVREQSGIELEGHDIEEPWAVFDVTLDGWSGEYEGNVGYLEQPPVILTALPERRWRVYMRPTSPEADLVAEAAAVIARYQPDARPVDVENAVRFHCHSKVAAEYRRGRVLLAGDAAHVCSPAEGHGMNSGLQDAANLAWKLAMVCRGTAAPELLDSYGAERRPVAEGIVASGDAVEESGRVAGAEARAARDAAIRAAFADPEISHDEAIAEAELNISYAGSPIVSGVAGGQLGAGERLPDIGPLRLVGGGERRLHELGEGRRDHVLIVLAGGGGDGAGAALEPLLAELREVVADSGPFEDVVALDADPALAEWLGFGAGAVTLLVVRPDGYVGMRADGADAGAATARAYAELLGSRGLTRSTISGPPG